METTSPITSPETATAAPIQPQGGQPETQVPPTPVSILKGIDIAAITKKIPVIAGITVIVAVVFLAIIYVVLQQQQQQPQTVKTTPTPIVTMTTTPTGTPTPFPTAVVTKSLYLSLLDAHNTVKNIAEIAPNGTVTTITTPPVSPYDYVKTDKQKAVTEFGQVSADGKYRAKVTPTTIDIAATETPNSFVHIAKTEKGTYVYGYFISNTQYAFSFVPVPCNLDRQCLTKAKSTVIYDAVANKFHGLQNSPEGIPSIYLGANDNYFIFTNGTKPSQDTYYLVGKSSYSVSAVVIPSSIFSTIVWGPQLDVQNNRVMYLSKGFSDTVEIGYYDLKARKETITTEIPALVAARNIDPNKTLRYSVHYFKDFTLAYITMEYYQGEVDYAFKTYYYSAPDGLAKEFTANPDLWPFLISTIAPEQLAYDPTTSQLATFLSFTVGSPRSIFVIDTKDLGTPAPLNIPIVGTLPPYTNANLSGWKN